MSEHPLILLGNRMARRNNLVWFVWLCALVLPLALQWLALSQDEVADYLRGFGGPVSLYVFFTMSYSFAAVFCTYYIVSGYRRAGTLDLLRVAALSPADVHHSAFLQLQQLLLPPVLGFLLILGGYAWISWLETRDMMQQLSWLGVTGNLVIVVLNQALLCSLVLLNLFRNEGGPALLAILMVMPLNMAPVLVFMGRIPLAGYIVVEMALLALLLFWGSRRVRALWPPRLT